MKLEKVQPVYRQIEQHLRAAIDSGEYPLGARLPSVQELALQYGTSVFSIQSALAPLERDGLVKRTPRQGTFVLNGKKRLTQVGLYFGSDLWHGSARAFYKRVKQKLDEEFSREKLQCQMWVDMRPPGFQSEPLKELEVALIRKEIQGVIGLMINAIEWQWISRINVPLAIAGTASTPARVGQDYHKMLGEAMDDLKSQGCQSVGFIFPRPVWDKHGGDDILWLFHSFVNQATDRGLRIQTEWICTPTEYIQDEDHEAFGYRMCQILLRREERPDGLIVYPDIAVRGAITAILESGIKVPSELKLALHQNEGGRNICALPATWMITSEREYARALIRQVQEQFYGREVQPIFLPAKVTRCPPDGSRVSFQPASLINLEQFLNK